MSSYELDVYEISSTSIYGGGSRAAYSMGYEPTGYDALSGYSLLDESNEDIGNTLTTAPITTTTSSSSSSYSNNNEHRQHETTTTTTTPLTTPTTTTSTTSTTSQSPMSVIDTIRVRTTTNFRGFKFRDSIVY